MNNKNNSITIKNTKEYHGNNDEKHLSKNHSNISIHHRSKIRNENNEKYYNKTNNNAYLLTPVYQTLKADNYIDNYHYQPSINLINSKEKKKEDKYITRQNIVLPLNQQSSFNGNSNLKNINKDKTGTFIKAKLEHQINGDNNNNSYKINNRTGISNSNSYINIYSSRYSPYRAQETDLTKPGSYKETEVNVNYKKYYTNKEEFKKVEKKVNHEKNNEKITQTKKNHFESVVVNSKNKNNNIEKTKIGLNRVKANNCGESEIKYDNEKSSYIMKYNKSTNSINNTQNFEINKNFNNNFFYKIEANKSSNKIKLKENQNSKNIKKEDKNNIQNIIYKSNNIFNQQKSDIKIFKSENNVRINSANNNNRLSHSLYQKGLEIVNKIIRNRKYKYWIEISSKLLNQKSYSNYKLFTRKIRTYKNKENLPTIDIQSQIRNTLDNDIDYNNNYLLNKMKDKYNIILKTNVNSKNVQEKCKDSPNNNLLLKNQDSNILKENNESVKKLEFVKEINKKFSKSPRTNNLMIENKDLINKLKNIYIKYLINKNNDYNKKILKAIFYKYNKKAAILKYTNENTNNILYKLLKIKKSNNNKLLSKYFYRFYYISNFINYSKEIKALDNEQRNILINKILFNIFHKKAIKEQIYLNKYFSQFYYKCSINKVCKNYEIIHNEEIYINKKNNSFNNQEKTKNKIRLIINNIEKNNNIIIKSVLKQWNLKSKIIELIIKSDEGINMRSPLKAYTKNENKINNSKEDKIIKGLKKLNDIFMNKNTNKVENGNGGLNNLKEEEETLVNSIVKKNLTKKNIIQYYYYNKIYDDKLKYRIANDIIIEEKEEEQAEDNGENIYTKNGIEKEINENANNINKSSNQIINSSNNKDIADEKLK